MAWDAQARRFRPFGAGVRNCLGQQLANVNIPTAIAMLVSSFKMQLSEEVCLLDCPALCELYTCVCCVVR